MSGFFKSVTWQGLVSGAVIIIVIGHIASK